MSKHYQCFPGLDGCGPRIAVKRDIIDSFEPDDYLRFMESMKKLCMWGGPSGSNPETYMWEFPDGINYAKAIVILRTSGFMAER